jgi:para-aminobenzoate synthetase component 1
METGIWFALVTQSKHMLNWLNEKKTISEMNKLGHNNCPFLFVISFEKDKNLIIEERKLKDHQIGFDLPNYKFENLMLPKINRITVLNPEILEFEKYKQSFDFVKNEILKGNSFLTNLTVSSALGNNINLQNIYNTSTSKYKLIIDDYFVCYSPEGFVSISENGKISSFPMKGTISSRIENAKEIILNDQKELFEHTTIVDLIRNDLSKICEKVWVEKFRYIDEIKKQNGQTLYQVSSEVSGYLPKNWKSNMGKLIMDLLPAGSISGAPKIKTLGIIKKAEKTLHKKGKRNHYTGIFGYFDGKSIYSGVMIRFIEKIGDEYFYKSGGGITFKSDGQKEYKELIEKIYVPVL